MFNTPKSVKKIIFINKNWFNDMKVGYKASFGLVELINFEIDLEEKSNLKSYLNEKNYMKINFNFFSF
jgi:hypothetical protein